MRRWTFWQNLVTSSPVDLALFFHRPSVPGRADFEGGRKKGHDGQMNDVVYKQGPKGHPSGGRAMSSFRKDTSSTAADSIFVFFFCPSLFFRYRISGYPLGICFYLHTAVAYHFFFFLEEEKKRRRRRRDVP